MQRLILIASLLQIVLAAPQLISFKDGKVGVNFFGYHAEAGLGGGQNGANGGLLGGLHASAGTPWGQNAAAGLGGNVNGRAAGLLYAGAQATPDVGASAVLGGDTSQGGFSGTDAYANGKINSHRRTIVAGNTKKTETETETETDYQPQYPPQPVTENANAIQKIKPPKKYHPSESYDFVEKSDFNLNSDVAFNANKNKATAADADAVAVAAIVLRKTINKTATLATPVQTDEQYNIAQTLKAPSEQSLTIDSNNNNDNNRHNHFASNELNTKSLASSTLAATPSSIPAAISLSHSLNGYNANGNISADGVADTNPTGVITVTRERTKLRTRAHKHRSIRQQKRINANRQRQTSKTITKVVEQQYATEAQQQQRPVRRQLIAAPPLAEHGCDTKNQECKTVNREVRSNVVQNALEIPIGILQSLQQSLSRLGGSH